MTDPPILCRCRLCALALWVPLTDDMTVGDLRALFAAEHRRASICAGTAKDWEAAVAPHIVMELAGDEPDGPGGRQTITESEK